MDPQEIIAASGQIVAAGSALAAAVPFTSIVKRMLGPAADEIAERVRDEIKLYRYGRQLSMLSKAEKLAREAGFTPKAVPVKLLFGLLEGASLEESEDLHDKWAALLANAANPSATVPVRPSFMDTLKLLTPEAAKLLDAVYAKAGEDPRGPASPERVSGRPSEPSEERTPPAGAEEENSLTARERTLRELGHYSDVYRLYRSLGFTADRTDTLLTSASSAKEMEQDERDRQQFAVVMDELTRFQMWSVTQGKYSERFYLTSYAVQFVRACAAPSLTKRT